MIHFNAFAKLFGGLSQKKYQKSNASFHGVILVYKKEISVTKNKVILEWMIKALSFLHINVYPLALLEETIDFLTYISDLFVNHSQLKIVFIKVFYRILLKLAKVIT